jgi:hypothetical protein
MLAAIAVPALAQTTGVVGINDYTINGVGSGSTSCTAVCHATPVNLSLDVSTAPNNIVVYVLSFCPCFGGFVCGGPNPCLPAIPFSACGATSNQSFDLQLGCVTQILGIAVANTAGNANLPLPLPFVGPAPACSIPTATQAIILDVCGVGLPFLPGPFVLSQSYDLQLS